MFENLVYYSGIFALFGLFILIGSLALYHGLYALVHFKSYAKHVVNVAWKIELKNMDFKEFRERMIEIKKFHRMLKMKEMK